VIFIAILLDLCFGEPTQGHPLVAFGHLVTLIENICFNIPLSHLLQTIIGFLALALALILVMAPLYYLKQWIAFHWMVTAILLYFCIASQSLKQHAQAVFQALEQEDLLVARQKVAMMVSRNCDEMDALAIRRATIESVLENGADAVFAPLFWFVVGGVEAAIVYRLCNTLDAMWGYKNSRYLHFGWAAARLDDLLNIIPARLTALSYILLANTRLGWHCWRTQASLLASFNAGVVMTAGAGSLDLKLGGASSYHGLIKEKPFFGGANLPINNDINRANQLINLTLILWLGLFSMCLLGLLFDH
jgi:adenosylcobinamide-phosphate synthase